MDTVDDIVSIGKAIDAIGVIDSLPSPTDLHAGSASISEMIRIPCLIPFSRPISHQINFQTDAMQILCAFNRLFNADVL